MKDQRNELKQNEARLLAKEQEQMEMENDITKQSQEIPFCLSMLSIIFFCQEILKAGERQKQEQEDLDLETAALSQTWNLSSRLHQQNF